MPKIYNNIENHLKSSVSSFQPQRLKQPIEEDFITIRKVVDIYEAQG